MYPFAEIKRYYFQRFLICTHSDLSCLVSMHREIYSSQVIVARSETAGSLQLQPDSGSAIAGKIPTGSICKRRNVTRPSDFLNIQQAQETKSNLPESRCKEEHRK